MTRNQLFKELNALCIKLDKEWDINCGGCCYVAYVLAKYLEEYNISFVIRHYYDPCHYVVEVPDRCLNRGGFNGEYESLDWDYIDLMNIYKTESWNKYYDIKHNSAVHLKIKAIFNKYGHKRI